MKIIKLTKGKSTVVDDIDYEYLSQRKWQYNLTQDKNEYAFTQIKGKTTYMHRIIMNAQKGQYIDHVNGNSLDNCRINLRLTNNQLNQANSKIGKNNTSGYKGVTWNKKLNKWQAQLMFNWKHIHLGLFSNKIDAAKAYNKRARELFREYARLNEV